MTLEIQQDLYLQIDQLLTKLLDEAGITDRSPGSVINALLEANLFGWEQIVEYFNSALAANKIEKATGERLDELGKLIGIPRRTPFNSTDYISYFAADETFDNFKFYIDPNTNKTAGDLIAEINSTGTYNISSIQIKAGTKIYSVTDDYEFVTLYDTEPMSGNDIEVYVPIMSTSPVLNAIEPNILVIPDFVNNPELKSVARYILCTNTKEISSIARFETDEEYRQRIMNRRFIDAAMNETAVRFAALSVSGVADINIYAMDPAPGIGRIVVIPEFISTSEKLLDAVRERVEQVMAWNMPVIIQFPIYIGVTVKLCITFQNEEITTEEQSSIFSTVKYNIIQYINNLRPGDSIDVETIRNIARTVDGVKNVFILKIGIGDYENGELLTYKDLNTINAKAKINIDEKFVTNPNLIEICKASS
ncbi:MAG: baseplate J/gp47 family protein [Candidatus Helarchaeota archaeon]